MTALLQLNTPRRPARSQLKLLVVGLALMTLACGLLGPGPRSTPGRVTMLSSLPTFTRTPLPPLLPAATATPMVQVQPNEPAAALPAPPHLEPADSPDVMAAGALPDSPDSLAANGLPPAAAPLAVSPAETPATNPAVPTAPETSLAVSFQPAVTTDPLAATVPPVETAIPTATAATAPTATATPTSLPTPTPSPVPQGWAFSGVNIYTDAYEGGLLVYGNVVNNTGSSQELLFVSGTFQNAQGQIVAGADSTYAYWPGYVVPPGGSMPFELYVDGVHSAAKFDLNVEAESSSSTPRQDFEFSDVNQWPEDDAYCVGGKVRNPGSGLQEYLIVAAILYDSQDKVINFSDYGEYGSGAVGSGQAVTFEICIDPPNQGAARHELRAWGQ